MPGAVEICQTRWFAVTWVPGKDTPPFFERGPGPGFDFEQGPGPDQTRVVGKQWEALGLMQLPQFITAQVG